MWLCGIVHALGMAYAIQKAPFVVLIHSYALLILQWRYNGRDDVSNHHPHGCLLNRLFGRRSKKTSKLRVNGLCGGNSPVTGEIPAQRASNEGNVSIWWRHHGLWRFYQIRYNDCDWWDNQKSYKSVFERRNLSLDTVCSAHVSLFVLITLIVNVVLAIFLPE